MNFLEQLFQAIAAVPQVQQKGAPNAGSAVPQPVQAAPPVNNPSRLGMFAMMPPQGSAAGGVAPPAPPQRPVARSEPGQAQAVPPVRAPSPPQQGAGPSNGLSLDFQRQLARIPGFESYVDEAALAAADRGAPAPTMRASGPMGVTGSQGPQGSQAGQQPALAGPSAATYLSGALQGATRSNNPLGMLFGALGGAMNAGQGVEQKNQMLQLLTSNGMKPEQAALFLQSPEAYKMINPGQQMTSALKEYQFARQQGYEGSFQQYQIDQKKAAATVVNTNVNTKGQTEVDKLFAAEYNDYVLGGKAADLKNQVGMLDDAIQKLRSTPGITGLAPGAVSILGEAAQNILTPETKQIRQDIETVAQRSLKEVLGAQFARVEGEMLLERAFNPYLHPEVNARRAEQIKNVIQSMAAAKDHASNYFASNGFSMQGYKPPEGAMTGNSIIEMRKRWEAEDAEAGVPFGRNRGNDAAEAPIVERGGKQYVKRDGKWFEQ